MSPDQPKSTTGRQVARQPKQAHGTHWGWGCLGADYGGESAKEGATPMNS